MALIAGILLTAQVCRAPAPQVRAGVGVSTGHLPLMVVRRFEGLGMFPAWVLPSPNRHVPPLLLPRINIPDIPAVVCLRK